MDDKEKPDQELLRYWLALLYAPGLGSRGISKLLEQIETPKALFDGALNKISTLPQKAQDYLKNPDWQQIDQALQWAEGDQRHIITRHDPYYPAHLNQISDPPPLLFVNGDPEVLATPQLAVVGSRNPTPSGRQNAEEFSRFLAASGITISSGLATGIDGAAHQGALRADGLTLAVTGTGPDRIYPGRHRDLAHQIVEQGALVTEFPPGTRLHPGNFPRRNRIISGLSLGTLVVEAAKKSGSLITARLAMEQGREVFAIPGSIHNPLSRGCHSLIRQGAKLVETAEDILEELAPLLSNIELPEGAAVDKTSRHEKGEEWDEEYHQLFTALDYDPLPIDLLIERSGLAAEAVSSMLLMLELEGRVSSAPGGRYCLTT
ncbi:MAG: DNA-processing protein DprA [Candidatus Sedimenticola sp. (ex Thyasira tokunagai)]